MESVLFLTVTVVWLLREGCPGKLGQDAKSFLRPALQCTRLFVPAAPGLGERLFRDYENSCSSVRPDLSAHFGVGFVNLAI